jgi:hypothetical protein
MSGLEHGSTKGTDNSTAQRNTRRRPVIAPIHR